MTDGQKKELLRVARRVVEAAVRGLPVPEFASEDPLFAEKRGAFVTLHNHGELRGCIGRFEPAGGLLETVVEMAQAAATEDPRFRLHPIRAGELKDIDIEISVLTPLERAEDPLSLELGRHGIYIRKGYAAGCFLPQVATETGWGKEEFLSQCCAGKAGLGADAWKEPDTEVYLFEAEILCESHT